MRLLARPHFTIWRSSQFTHSVAPEYMTRVLASFIQFWTRGCHSSSDRFSLAAPICGMDSWGDPIATNGPKLEKWLTSRVSREKSSTEDSELALEYSSRSSSENERRNRIGGRLSMPKSTSALTWKYRRALTSITQKPACIGWYFPKNSATLSSGIQGRKNTGSSKPPPPPMAYIRPLLKLYLWFFVNRYFSLLPHCVRRDSKS